MKSKLIIKSYSNYVQEIKQHILSSQFEALKNVNKEMIMLYFQIGKMIVENQINKGWKKAVVQTLSKDLQAEFPDTSVFSADNLWRMRKFYLNYVDKPKLMLLAQEIAWAQNIIIMEKCKREQSREYYLRMTKKYGWTKNALIKQIENQSYEKTIFKQVNLLNLQPERIKKAKLSVKDEYTFDFLEMNTNHAEHWLEQAMLAKINRFLAETDGTFAFMGNKFRIEGGGHEHFIDLLLYQRRLKCMVAIELKAEKYSDEYADKMQFYLRTLDSSVKEQTENPSIGIIICTYSITAGKDRKHTSVGYVFKNVKKTENTADYRVTSILPKELRRELPAPAQIQRLFAQIKILSINS